MAESVEELPAFPIAALLTDKPLPKLRVDDNVDAEQILRDADVIFGVDVRSGKDFVVFGRDLLRGVIDSGKSQRFKVLRIAVESESKELEKLLAAVQVVKGHHDFQVA